MSVTIVPQYSVIPSRQRPATFAADKDQFLSEENPIIAAKNAQAQEVNALATAVDEQSQQVADAAAIVGATKWVTGENVAEGLLRWSPSDGMVYRHRETGVTVIDPADDADPDTGHWWMIASIKKSGNHVVTFIATAPTTLTLPTSGKVLTDTAPSTYFFVGNGAGVATPVAMSGDATLANTGAITVSKIGGKTVSLGGNFTTVGAFAAILRVSAATDINLPTTGTLATTANLAAEATQAQMEAATDTATRVSPAKMKFHPGVAKVWVSCGVSGNILGSQNVASVTDTGTGSITVTFSTGFSSLNYVALPSILSVSEGIVPRISGKTTGSVQAKAFYSNTLSLVDPTTWDLACFGDQ